VDLNSDEVKLLNSLKSIHEKLRNETYSKYKRINPFVEDLFEWNERGYFWSKDKTITIYNSTTVVGNVVIGSRTWIGPFCSIDGTGGLEIGNNCSIATGCQISTHDTVKWALSNGEENYEYSPIRIGNCCFLGAHSIVTKGVSIGDHCLVAAGSVVTNDIPSFSIVGGIPGRVIGDVTKGNDGKIKLIYK